MSETKFIPYYKRNRDKCLAYQKQYNKGEKYKIYQQNYYQENKIYLKEKHKEYIKQYNLKNKKIKKLPKYKLKAIERVIKNKLKDYLNTLKEEKKANKIVNNNDVKPFDGFIVKGNKFVLTFT